MNPLSRRKRLTYLVSLAVVFVFVIPIIIFYAIGYRLHNYVNVVKTGGIYVSTDLSGMEVYLDGTLNKTTSIFQRSFLVSGLKPGMYNVSVRKDGYWTWDKKVRVAGEKVTEIHPFTFSKNIGLAVLPEFLLSDGSPVTATSSSALKSIKNKIVNPEFKLVSSWFTATTTTVILPSATINLSDKKDLVVRYKMALWREKDAVHARWLGDKNDVPYYFCIDDHCPLDISVPAGSELGHFDFYPGREDLVVMAGKEGIYVSEIDNRISRQNSFLLLPGEGLDFRISPDGIFYLKKNNSLFRVEL